MDDLLDQSYPFAELKERIKGEREREGENQRENQRNIYRSDRKTAFVPNLEPCQITKEVEKGVQASDH